MSNSYEDALTRIPSQKEKIIKLLRERGAEGALNTELVKISLHYGSRLSELNKEGYVIEAIQVKGGLWKHVLHKVPGEVVFYADAVNDVAKAAYVESNQGWIRVDRFLEIVDEQFCKIVRKPGYYKQQYNFESYQDHNGQQLELF